MAKNKFFQIISLVGLFLLLHIIVKAEDDTYKYYNFDDNNSIGMKITAKENGKMLATIVNKKDENVIDSFFTNNLSEVDFNNKLKTFLEKKMTLDTKGDGFNNKLSNLTYQMYINVPTNSTPIDGDKQTAVTLYVKKNIRIHENKKNILYSPQILSDILNYSINKMKELYDENKNHKYQESLTIKGTIEKKGSEYIHHLNVQGLGSLDIELKKGIFDYNKSLNFKPFISITKGINYMQDVPDVNFSIVYKKETVDSIFTYETITEASTNITYTIDVNKLSIIHGIIKLDCKNLETIENFKKEHNLNWEKITEYIGEDLLNASGKDYTYLREQLAKLGIETSGDITSEDFEIVNFLQLYKLSNKLIKENECHKKIDRVILAFIDQFKSKNNLLFEVKNIKMTINSGRIEDIRIAGNYNSDFYVFGNKTPIGFSSKHNITNVFPSQILFTKNQNNKVISLSIKDAINVDYSLFLNTKDFSPDDQEVNMEITKNNTEIVLTRDSKRDLINLRAFTDLQGINENEPNGLIQIEASRQFNIWSTLKQCGSKYIYIGGFAFLKPYFLLSKIENKEKDLNISRNDSLINGQFVSNKSATLIDIYKYQIFQTGAELNLFMIGHDHLKVRGFIDLGVQYFYTRYNDSVVAKDNNIFKLQTSSGTKPLGAFNWYPQFKIQVSATDRIGIEGYYRRNYISLLSREIKLNSDKKEPLEYSQYYKGVINTYSAEVFYKPVQKDKVYARVTFNVQPNAYNDHFFQIQIGYNTALFLNTKK